MKKLTLKNHFLMAQPQIQVKSLQDWLFSLKLHGKESRSRTRFIGLISARIKELDNERIKLAEEYAEKNKKGEIIYLEKVKDKDGKETGKTKEITEKKDGTIFKFKDAEKFQKVWLEYLNEDLIIDVSPETNETIYTVRDIILNSNEEFNNISATIYEEWCRCFENIK